MFVNMDHSELYSRDVLPALSLLAGFVTWILCRIILDCYIRWYKPEFYKELKTDFEGKYMVFFGLVLGLLAKPITLAGYGLAVWKTPAEDDIAGIHPPMNTYQEFCWSSRLVIYVSELPHYLHIPEMTLHHLLVLMAMGVVARWRGPHRGYDLSLAALWAEIPNSLRAILKRTHYLQKRPLLDWHLAFWGTMIGFLTRAPALIVGMAMIPQSGLQKGPAHIVGCAYFFYLAYIFNITYRRLRNSDALQVEDSGVFRFRFSDRFNINSTSLITGLAILSTKIVTLFLYNWKKTNPAPATTPELINITWNLLMAVTVGLLISHLVAPRLQKVLERQRISSVYLQTGTFIAAGFIFLTPTLASSADRVTLVGCALLCSSLSKAASQWASHLASVGEGSGSRASLACALLNLMQFCVAVAAVAMGQTVLDTAFGSILLQAVIRLAVDTREADNTNSKAFTIRKKFMSLSSFIMLKAAWRMREFVSISSQNFSLSGNYTQGDESNLLETIQSVRLLNLQAILKYTVEEFLVFGIICAGVYIMAGRFVGTPSTRNPTGTKGKENHKSHRLRTIGLISLGLWACYIGYLVSNGETPEAHNQNRNPLEILAKEPPFCGLVLSWQFWVSITASVVIPTVAAHILQPKSVSYATKSVKSDSFWDQE